MSNENPIERVNPRVRDKIAAQKAGKSLRIVVPGKCRVCKNRSADVPMTKQEALLWVATKEAPETLPKYAKVMLTEGTHRECQPGYKAPAKQPLNTVGFIIAVAEREDREKRAAQRAARIARNAARRNV